MAHSRGVGLGVLCPVAVPDKPPSLKIPLVAPRQLIDVKAAIGWGAPKCRQYGGEPPTFSSP